MNIFVPVILLQNKCELWCQFINSSQSVRLGGSVIAEPALLMCFCIPKGQKLVSQDVSQGQIISLKIDSSTRIAADGCIHTQSSID